MISRICETFECTPSQAKHELDDDPILVSSIMEMRAFRDAKYYIETTKFEDFKANAATTTYMQIEAEIMTGLLGIA